MTESLDLQSQFDHERVIIERHPEVDLTLIIAIHSTALGPGEGGLRIKEYPRIDDAIVDALRLSAAMTLKSSVAGLPFGGGKAVALAPVTTVSREELMHAIGDVVGRLDGAFIVGPDSGTGESDMDLILDCTEHVVGYSPARGGLGDPSPSTARTVFGSIRHALGLADGATFDGRSVAILGVGKVGHRLAHLLSDAGAEVIVADIAAERAAETAKATGARAVDACDFLDCAANVLAPCGAGEVIDLADAQRVKAEIVCGAANNPLISDDVAMALHERGILYVPDFVANCGGVVHNSVEYRGGTLAEVELALVEAITRAATILDRARAEGRPPLAVARRTAMERIERAAA